MSPQVSRSGHRQATHIIPPSNPPQDLGLVSNSNKISIVHVNCDGFLAKLPDLECLISRKNIDVLNISESHLKPETKNLAKLSSYEEFHYCRPGSRKKGGSSIFVKEELNPVREGSFDDLCQENVFELCAVRIRSANDNIVLINVYRVPTDNNSKCDEFHDRFEDLCTRIVTNNDRFIISGDFNFDILDPSRQTRTFMDIIDASGFSLCCNDPTRGNACLDNFIVLSKDKVPCHVHRLGLSDHHVIEILYPFNTCDKPAATNIRSFLDWEYLDTLWQNLDWSDIVKCYNANDKYNNLIQKITICLDECTKLRKVRNKKKNNSWINNEVLKSCTEKKRLHEMYLQDRRNSDAYEQYREYSRRHKSFLRREKTQFKRNQLTMCNNDSKKIWKLVNKERGSDRKTTIDKLQINDSVCNSQKEIADCFANHFSLIQDRITKQQLTLDIDKVNLPKMCDVDFSPELTSPQEVFCIINRLDANKAIGEDGIGVKILKRFSCDISFLLSDIINASLLQGIFPDRMKAGKLSAVFKNKGSVLCVDNYRPITVLNTMSKIVERIMHDRLYKHLSKNNLLNPQQFGFQKGKSTQDAVLHFLSKIISDKENGLIPVGIFYDLSKAFDCVNHSILLKKLESAGVHGSYLDWFSSYLKNRPWHFALNVQGNKPIIVDNDFRQNVGVPQGSVLGPLLFLLYSNDMFDALLDNLSPVAFADDTSGSFSVTTVNDIEPNIQTHNQCMISWSKSNGLDLNEAKNAYVVFHNSQPQSNVISFCNETKLLGITIDSKLRYETHAGNVMTKIKSAIFYLSTYIMPL